MFAGIFLAFSLVFLASLYWKYADKLRQRDRKEHGCPVHGHCNDTHTHNELDNASQYDIHQFARDLEASLAADDDDKKQALIEQAFNISTQIVANSANIRISTDTKLAFYGLFKQATLGEIGSEHKEPSKLMYTEHAKWSAWNVQKGKSMEQAKKEYFDLVYSQIVKANNLNIYLFQNEQQIPSALKEQMKQSGGGSNQSSGFSMAAPNSKIGEEEFDEEIHGDRSQLFNQFDLSNAEQAVDVNAIKSYIETHDVDIDAQNENGTTFLNLAVDNDQYELSKLLIETFGADVNKADDMGYSPLHSAALNGNAQIIQLLLQHGADKTAKSCDEEEDDDGQDGETPYDLAQDLDDDIKQLLITTTD